MSGSEAVTELGLTYCGHDRFAVEGVKAGAKLHHSPQ
jgi:hypothetical protein